MLAKGDCEVLVKDLSKKEMFVAEITSGTLFGEVALLFNVKRTSSVRCKDECTIGSLSQEFFKELIE